MNKPRLWLASMLGYLAFWVLWFLHGSPKKPIARRKFAVKDLAENCRRIGGGFLIAPRLDIRNLEQTFGTADLLVLVGELSIDSESLAAWSFGMVRARQSDAVEAVTNRGDVRITVEFAKQPCQESKTLAAIAVPVQPYDGALGLTLKTDLLADDLLIQAVKLLQDQEPEQVCQNLTSWIAQVITPYLMQFKNATTGNMPGLPAAQRFRRVSRLLLDTLLLCSPIQVGRNWLRRLRGKYPVLILTHHLVSDRPHRMGVPTEIFWRLLQFLTRHYRLASMSDGETMLRSGRVTYPTVVVTLDDGYRDNFINLRAVAEETEAPVSLFVSTRPVEDGQRFQHDLQFGEKEHLALTWDQILCWRSYGAEFGSHTRTHFDCGSKDRAALREELVGSRVDLENHLHEEVRFFAFPFGQTENMSREAVDIAARSYALSLSGLDGENQPFVDESSCLLWRKAMYPNRWELELELQSIFLLVNRWRERLNRQRQRLRMWRNKAPACAGSPSAEWSASPLRDD